MVTSGTGKATQNSEKYKSGEYKDYKIDKLPIPDLDILKGPPDVKIFKKILKAIIWWKVFEPYPPDIYIYLIPLFNDGKNWQIFRSFLAKNERSENINHHFVSFIFYRNNIDTL